MAKAREESTLVPTQFRLAGMDWRVVFSETLADLGQCDNDTNTITIRQGMSKQQTEQAFCHELVHAIFYTMGNTDDHDEKLVEGFVQLLYQYLRCAA